MSMTLQTLIPLVLQASLFLLVFALGLKSTMHEASYLFRRPSELVRAVLSMNILMPIFAVGLVMIFDLDPAVKIALVALSVSPIPPLLPNKLVKAGGTDEYSVGLLIGAGLLAIILVPVAMEILERVFNVPLQMTVGSVATLILVTVLLPLGLGVAGHLFVPSLAEGIAKAISKAAGIGLLVSLGAVLFSAAPAFWSLIGNGTVLAFAAFVLVGLAVGHILGGPAPENRTALAVCTASRHPGIAIAIAQANFSEEKLAMAAVLLYMIVDGVVSIPYHMWTKRKTS